MTIGRASFLYQPYEIAPYAAGSTGIELHSDELVGLLKPEYPGVFRDQVPF